MSVVTKPSPRSVDDTVQRLSELAVSKGMKVFAVIDHSGEAHSKGLELRDTKVVLFGSPEAGTPVMAAAPLAALDLPLKVLVWADGDQTNISYTAPATLVVAGRIGGEDGRQPAGGGHVQEGVQRGDPTLGRQVDDAPPVGRGDTAGATGSGGGRRPVVTDDKLRRAANNEPGITVIASLGQASP